MKPRDEQLMFVKVRYRQLLKLLGIARESNVYGPKKAKQPKGGITPEKTPT